MNEAASTIEAPPISPLRSKGALLWAGVFALSILTAVATFASETPLRFLLPGLIGLACVAAFVARRPALSVAWLPVLMVPPEFLKVFAYEVAAVLVFGILLVAGIFRRREWVWQLDPIELTSLGFLAYGAFTYLWVVNTWWWLFMVRKLILGFIALWLGLRLGRWIPRHLLLGGISAGACAVAALAMYVSMTVGLTQDFVARTEATNVGWANSNSLAALLVLLLPTAMLIALRPGNVIDRIIAWSAIPLIASVISAAGSRGGSVAMAVALVAMLARHRISRRGVLASAAIVLGAMAMLVGPTGRMFVERFSSTKDQFSILVRLLFWREAWRRMVHLPFGFGLGQSMYYPDKLFGSNPHNYWLEILPEVGLIGTAFWIATVVLIWRRARKLNRTPGLEADGHALLVTVVVSQLNCLYEPTFTNLQYTFMFYWIVGVYLGSARQVTESRAAQAAP